MNHLRLPTTACSIQEDVNGIGGSNTDSMGPHCRRCRNHNQTTIWKGHKKICPYRNCTCDLCRLINVRKDTEKALREMIDESKAERIYFHQTGHSSPVAPTPAIKINTNNSSGFTSKLNKHLRN